MRFLSYNIRYATRCRFPRVPWRGYFGRTEDNLSAITRFIKDLQPDVVGLLEVDAGSYRSGRCNQAQLIAEALGHYHTYRSKYGERSLFGKRIPLFNKQGNAFLARDGSRIERFHYFSRGMKKLIIELEFDHLTLFLVHLALRFGTRHAQLSDLYSLVKGTPKPHIVAGDFNALYGEREIQLFQAATGLQSAGPPGQPTFPSWAPRRQLDFILVSPEIAVRRFWLPEVTFSDHLPLVCDFEVRPPGETPQPNG